jgi:outer membrane protein assembly factor BamB
MTLFETSRGEPMVAATGKDGILYAQHRNDLSPAWSVLIAIGCICPECGCGSLSTPAFDGRTLYVGSGAAPESDTEGGAVYAIDPDTGAILWSRLLNGTVIAPVTVAGGVLFVATVTGLEIFDAGTGDQLWLGPADLIYSQPVVAGGAVYTTQIDGRVICWRPLVNAFSPKENE